VRGPSRTRPPDPASADLEFWRGRSRELPDAGPLPWTVLLAGLETSSIDPSDHESDFATMGFSEVEQTGGWPDSCATRLRGARYGRQVEILLGVRDHGWGTGTAMVTWVRATAPELHALGGQLGSFIVDPSETTLAAKALSRLTDVPAVWNGVRVRAGAHGLVCHRKITARSHPQGYLYDLWLLEHLADLLAAQTLPALDLTDVAVPYRTG